MNNPLPTHPLAGIYAAPVTPLKADFSPDLEALPGLLSFLAQRGAHGALLLGTTGEGPSFSPTERAAIWQAALSVRQEHPEFRLLAATGTPSLGETIELNKTAFDLGYDGVVSLPPYYFRSATEEGLFDWFSAVIERSLPSDGRLLAYHFPKVSGVSLSIGLLKRLADAFPGQFAGIKDSSGDFEHAKTLVRELGADWLVLPGNDKLLGPGLAAGASGCMTAPANLISPLLRGLWDAYHAGEDTAALQSQIDQARTLLEGYPPFPASLKGLLAELHGFPLWPVRPPLVDMDNSAVLEASAKLASIFHG